MAGRRSAHHVLRGYEKQLCALGCHRGDRVGELGVNRSDAVRLEGGVGVAVVEQRLSGQQVRLAVDGDELAVRDDGRGVEVSVVLPLDQAEHESLVDPGQPPQHGCEGRGVEVPRVAV